jgi:hypothetical protein
MIGGAHQRVDATGWYRNELTEVNHYRSFLLLLSYQFSDISFALSSPFCYVFVSLVIIGKYLLAHDDGGLLCH